MFENVKHPWEAIVELAEFNYRWMMIILTGAATPGAYPLLFIYVLEGKRASKYGSPEYRRQRGIKPAF